MSIDKTFISPWRLLHKRRRDRHIRWCCATIFSSLFQPHNKSLNAFSISLSKFRLVTLRFSRHLDYHPCLIHSSFSIFSINGVSTSQPALVLYFLIRHILSRCSCTFCLVHGPWIPKKVAVGKYVQNKKWSETIIFILDTAFLPRKDENTSIKRCGVRL